ncbi:zinc finger, CCHC-type, retrotransposon gag domain protein [Tanacetum coccineum]|uniref:Zinc finger, CCHC-type, retrotransposon gag domain protein n=1 Tax=Tanacetum coccineum TaxID=301880 RepID=A0ABQ4XJR7_9ASTR
MTSHSLERYGGILGSIHVSCLYIYLARGHSFDYSWADGIVNTEFTDVAQVADAARNIEILRKRSSQNNKRNRDGDRIRPIAQGSNQRGYDQKRYDGHGHDRHGSSQRGYDQKGYDGRSQKRYSDHASSPPCDICGKLHLDKACYRTTGACFTCGLTGHMARDCPKNGGNGGKGSGNDNQPAAKGRVFSSTKDQAANSSGTVSGTLFLNGRAVFVLFDTGATHSVSDHEYQNCPLHFDDKIRFANLLPLELSDFDFILSMNCHGGTMTMSLMHQWHDTICGGVIGPRRSLLYGAYGRILGTKREAGIGVLHIESFLNRDILIVSYPKFDSLLEEFSGELAHIDLISPEINEADFDPEEEIRLVEKLLYNNSSPRSPEEFNSKNSDAIIESFSLSHIPVEDSDSLMEEIDLFLTPDDLMPPGIENDDYDSKGDILFLE